VRITAQLIEAETERNLWADRYERSLTSILTLQGEVAQAIAKEIRVTVTPVEESLLTGRRQVNPEAYEAYLKGQSHWYKLTPADLETAHQYFQQALEKDPDYALAHVGVALFWIGLQQMGVVPSAVATPKAKEAALRAAELDDKLAETYHLSALLKTWADWDWEGGEADFRHTIELSPNYSDARAYYSHYLAIVGRIDEALVEMGRALELDPFNPLFRALYSAVLLADRRPDEAIAQARIALRNVPNHPVAYSCLMSAFHLKGMPQETYESYKAFNAALDNPEGVRVLEQGYEEGGVRLAMKRFAEWLAESSGSFPVTPFDVALTYNWAGEDEKVLEWLERGVELRDPNMPYFAMWPGLDHLHGNPHYRALLRKMNHPRLALSMD
jgi:tetratricopeptide (TPR) repeat protein